MAKDFVQPLVNRPAVRLIYFLSYLTGIVPRCEMKQVPVESPSYLHSLTPFQNKEKAVLGVVLGNIVVRGDVHVNGVNTGIVL